MSNPDPTNDSDLVTTGMALFSRFLVLLGLLGVAVPPIFQNTQVEQTIVSLVISVGGLVMTWLQHRKTTSAAMTARAKLSVRR